MFGGIGVTVISILLSLIIDARKTEISTKALTEDSYRELYTEVIKVAPQLTRLAFIHDIAEQNRRRSELNLVLNPKLRQIRQILKKYPKLPDEEELGMLAAIAFTIERFNDYEFFKELAESSISQLSVFNQLVQKGAFTISENKPGDTAQVVINRYKNLFREIKSHYDSSDLTKDETNALLCTNYTVLYGTLCQRKSSDDQRFYAKAQAKNYYEKIRGTKFDGYPRLMMKNANIDPDSD